MESMALVRDGLWEIVSGTETAPAESGDRRSKFLARRDRALATIVLAVEPSLLYLIGDPEDPVVVWEKLQNQFQKKTWANKLALHRRLHSLQLKDGESVQGHIKAMTELAIVGDAIEEEDRVVYLLASLPDSFNTLVTALEASEEVPNMEVVTERLLHAERKQKGKSSPDSSGEKAMTTNSEVEVHSGPQCHYCKKYGHILRNCTKRIRAEEEKAKQGGSETVGSKSPKGKKVGLVTQHVLGVREPAHDWIVDSGATCHICNSKAV